MNRTASLILFFALSLLFIVGVVMLLSKNKSQFENREVKAAKEEIRYVNTLVVKNDSVKVFIEGQGRISSSRKLDISSEVQGYLLPGSKIFKPGMTFKQGEVLFQIRDTEARLALQARKSSYLNILSNAMPDIRLDFPENAEAWKRYNDQIDILQPLPELPQTKSPREKTFIASKNIFGEYYSIRAEEERLKKYTIAAPFNGSVTDLYTEPGSVVNPGVKLLSIIKSDDLEVEIPVDVRNAGWLKTGQPVELTPTSGPAKFKGKVERIGEYVSATTQSIPVFISIDKKPDDILFNGMYLEANIHVGYVPNSIEVPRRALVAENSFYFWQDWKFEILDDTITRCSFAKITGAAVFKTALAAYLNHWKDFPKSDVFIPTSESGKKLPVSSFTIAAVNGFEKSLKTDDLPKEIIEKIKNELPVEYKWRQPTLVKKSGRIQFVKQNSIVLSDIPDSSYIVIEPVTQFSESIKYMPIVSQ